MNFNHEGGLRKGVGDESHNWLTGKEPREGGLSEPTSTPLRDSLDEAAELVSAPNRRLRRIASSTAKKPGMRGTFNRGEKARLLLLVCRVWGPFSMN